MNVEDFKEEVAEKVRNVFNDTEQSVSENKRILKEMAEELDDVVGDIHIMIDALPD
jgi:hypothetical protein